MSVKWGFSILVMWALQRGHLWRTRELRITNRATKSVYLNIKFYIFASDYFFIKMELPNMKL